MLRSIALRVAGLLAGCRCDDDAAGPDMPAADPIAAPEPETGAPPPHAQERLLVSHPSELTDVLLDELVVLDLAFAESDRLGRLGELDASTVCADIDLADLVRRTPKLRELRISGCVEPTHDLAALGNLESLTLSEIELDAEAISQLAQLGGLGELLLVRVTVPDKLGLDALEKLAVREVTLVDLQRDSALGRVLAMWPRTLEHATLVGSWAGHDAMSHLAKAVALERLELRDTRVGNFSLNQIKPLLRLRELVWSGDTFNDNSPLYFRELGVTSFECDCPRLGDGGLHTLRHCESIERLELPRSQVTGPGLAALAKLPALREIVLHDRDLGAAGLDALRAISTLRRLELSGNAADPSFAGLAALAALEQLRLHYPELDDRAAAELGRLVALRDLDLAHSQISDVGLAHFAALANLQVLVLSHTRVTNRGLAALSGLRHLRQLHLDHTDVVDAAVAHLTPLAELQTLRLDHTLVTDGAIDPLLELAALTRLDVSGTVISPEGMARLETLPSLVELVGPDG